MRVIICDDEEKVCQLIHDLIDWDALGYGDAELDEMVEFLLRLLQSFALDPGPARTRAQRRAFLRRWAAPAITQGMTGTQPHSRT